MHIMARQKQIFLSLFFPIILLSLSQTCRTHNITKILAEHPEFSQFNHYLTATRLASKINRQPTITVLAVDNSAMSAFIARHFTLQTTRHVLLLHILVDYYGSKELHQLYRGSTLSSSLFQAIGLAPGTTGYVNITDHKKGHVTFSPDDLPDGASPATYKKSIKEYPYKLSVIQVSSILTSPEAEAPAPPLPQVNLTEIMYAKGCKAFADLLLATADVQTTFDDNVIDGGLTVFCPIDSAVKAFMPKFKNLTTTRKTAILLYHGVPVHYSLQMLKDNNGLVGTLATGGGVMPTYTYAVKNANETVILDTKVDVASIKAVVHDEDLLSIFSIDKFLQPKEMFKAVLLAPAPAPAPHRNKKGKATDDSSSDDDGLYIQN